jgi:fumarylacetoacetase
MSYPIGETHDPQLRSWLESANDLQSDFPIQNLPLGVFRNENSDEAPSIGAAIGNSILDLRRAHRSSPFQSLSPATRNALSSKSLNAFMQLGPPAWSELRLLLSGVLRADHPDWKHHRSALEPLLVPAERASMEVPVAIGDYTDFYASIHHATRVGRLFRPDNPLLPNYKYVPIGYHGRASSIVVSGAAIARPCGQIKPQSTDVPVFQPTHALDYELELGCFIGPENAFGSPVSITDAESHIFGFSLVNDWSARDIQSWEYQPLGPFLSKNFGTTVSPWIVTTEALAPFRAPAAARDSNDPTPLPYLHSEQNRKAGAFDIAVEVFIRSERMQAADMDPVRLSGGNARDLYWTPAQLVAHHTSNGCNLRSGDLLATGTISGPHPDSAGCLLELTERGAHPILLPAGETRTFLEDGDEIIMTAFAERNGFVRIGLGECRGRITPTRLL